MTILFTVVCGGCGLERWLGSEPAEQQGHDEGIDRPPTVQTEQPPTPKGFSPQTVAWHEGTLEEALAEAKRAGKLAFVEVGAYWCPTCHRLNVETFVAPEVIRALNEGYVPVRIDAEKGEGAEIVERHRVQAYPTLLILEPSGLEKGRIVDFVDAPQLLTALRRIEQGDNVLADLEEVVENAPDDLDKRYHLAHAYALAAQRDRAEEHYNVVLAGDPKGLIGLASKVLYDRAQLFVHKLDGDREKALDAYRTLQRRFPESTEAIRAHRQIGRVLHELDRDDEAMASLDRMVASDPNDIDLKASYGWFCFRERVAPARGLIVVDAGLALDPDNAELHYLRAELLALLNRPEEALQAIRAAVASEPRSTFYNQHIERFVALRRSATP